MAVFAMGRVVLDTNHRPVHVTGQAAPRLFQAPPPSLGVPLGSPPGVPYGASADAPFAEGVGVPLQAPPLPETQAPMPRKKWKSKRRHRLLRDGELTMIVYGMDERVLWQQRVHALLGATRCAFSFLDTLYSFLDHLYFLA